MGVDAEHVVLDASVTNVASLRSWLEQTRPPLVDRLGTVRFAVDEQFAGDDASLRDGAVVALIPPVAGG